MVERRRLWWFGLALAGLIAVAEAAPRFPPSALIPISIAWLLALIATGVGLIAPLTRGIGPAWTGILVAAAVAGPMIATGVDWKGKPGVMLPCRRNWEWLPSYLLRSSPTRSVSATIGTTRLKICYGSPRARGRKVFGSALVPFGQLWRTGANEPTTIRLDGPLFLAGIRLSASASLYTVPGPETWEVILNRSTRQWGIESEYTADVAAREIGRAVVESRATESMFEALSLEIEPEPEADRAVLVLRWERTEVRIPLSSRPPR